MEDSGFDSGDVRFVDDERTTPIEVHVITSSSRQPLMADSIDDRRSIESNGKTTPRTSQLQKRIEKRLEQSKKNHMVNGTIDQQPRKGLISLNRLQVPNKPLLSDGAEKPLVSWETDSSEDEFEINPNSSSNFSRHAAEDFDLDLIPDEELDLIPPQPLNQRCACCQISRTLCVIQ